MNDVDEFLEHFGVKGMHWGQRKSPQRSGSMNMGKRRYSTLNQDSINRGKTFANGRTARSYGKVTDFLFRHRRKIMVARLAFLGITLAATGGLAGLTQVPGIVAPMNPNANFPFQKGQIKRMA